MTQNATQTDGSEKRKAPTVPPKLGKKQKPQSIQAQNELKALGTALISDRTTSERDEGTKFYTKFWKHSLGWCVIFPFLTCCCYYGFIASDRYVGESKVIIKQADTSSSSSFDIPLLGSGTSADMKDTQLIREFILSRDMLHHLDTTIALRKHYQSKEADILSRLWENDSQEAFLKFYRKHLTVDYDDVSGVLSIRAQAFHPDFAQQIVKIVQKHSEEYINQIGHRLANEQVNFVQTELERASKHLRQSKQHIRLFQEQYQLFSPEQESGAKLKVVNELEAELTRQRAAINNLRSYMNDSAADVMALNAQITALETQLAVERKKLVGTGNSNFSGINSQYAELLLDLEFATDLYKASLMSLEQARIEAYRKLKHLVVVDSPSLAEEAEFPKRFFNLTNILAVLLVFYGFCKITIATIREHRDV
ncbi:sugar transporter [Desulfosediminicola flagellatus]|uniref:sugar transporter n=1 Tax=Desulfosediminicola flagellatus TaxID=2569541 RepID=UPI0010AD2FE1|nr:sugar transporter [Desulfosediminicola flagellatus]